MTRIAAGTPVPQHRTKDPLEVAVDAAPLRPHGGDYEALRAFADSSGVPEARIADTYTKLCGIAKDAGLGSDGVHGANRVNEALLTIDALTYGADVEAYRQPMRDAYTAVKHAQGLFPADPNQVAADTIIRVHYPH
jgi:hypothetical protein